MRRSMDVKPIIGEALESCNTMANFIVEDLGASSRNGIQPRVAQSHDGVAYRQAAVFGDSNDLRSRKAM